MRLNHRFVCALAEHCCSLLFRSPTAIQVHSRFKVKLMLQSWLKEKKIANCILKPSKPTNQDHRQGCGGEESNLAGFPSFFPATCVHFAAET